MDYYPDEYEYEDEDNWLRCHYCGASDPDDLDQADHAGDCPLNPFGYNHPDFMKNLGNDYKEDLEQANDD